MKKCLKVKNGVFDTVLVAACSFVGVGFITGAEIWFYFARFGLNGIFGVVVFGILVNVLASFAMREKSLKPGKAEKLKTKILILSELLVASAMVSGLQETTRTLFSKWWFWVFLLSICLLIFLFYFEKKSFVLYNYFVAVFVLFVIVSLFLFNNKNSYNLSRFKLRDFSLKSVFYSLIFSCVYVFMNISEIRPILEKNKKLFSKNKKKTIAIILSLLLIFLVLLFSLMLLINNKIAKFSMPFLMSFKQKGGVSLFVFLIGIILTMISTAQSCLIGVKDKLNFAQNDEKFIKIIVIILSLILGQISFKIFIKAIYPILAVLNFFIFCLEIFESKKFRKN